jgi:hypothetical protein
MRGQNNQAKCQGERSDGLCGMVHGCPAIDSKTLIHLREMLEKRIQGPLLGFSTATGLQPVILPF